ncbi:MAG: pseudouridine synthase [Candidatus Omnitrophica bacterium]|nr:pseudouridine synthase [Candidatus Omnitrophota bacterium]
MRQKRKSNAFLSLGKVSLERALSKLGLMSRSQTRACILDGKLTVDGYVIKDPLFPVVPETAQFMLDGKVLKRSSWQTIMLYKPKGVVTTRSDEKGRRTVFDLLPQELKSLHPVGRLDMATTGLLLLTNDTQLSNYLTDPANAIPRVYVVTVEGKFHEADVRRAQNGVMDKEEFLKPSKVTLRKASGRESHLIVELSEGKNREIRRLFDALGHPVRKIKRITFGTLQLGDLQPGTFRFVTEKEFSWKRAEAFKA